MLGLHAREGSAPSCPACKEFPYAVYQFGARRLAARVGLRPGAGQAPSAADASVIRRREDDLLAFRVLHGGFGQAPSAAVRAHRPIPVSTKPRSGRPSSSVRPLPRKCISGPHFKPPPPADHLRATRSRVRRSSSRGPTPISSLKRSSHGRHAHLLVRARRIRRGNPVEIVLPFAAGRGASCLACIMRGDDRKEHVRRPGGFKNTSSPPSCASSRSCANCARRRRGLPQARMAIGPEQGQLMALLAHLDRRATLSGDRRLHWLQLARHGTGATAVTATCSPATSAKTTRRRAPLLGGSRRREQDRPAHGACARDAESPARAKRRAVRHGVHRRRQGTT